jgi:NADPH-dependent curcumin reductase CurA
MNFIDIEKMKIAQKRLAELKEEKRLIVEKLQLSADPNSPGDYTDAESLVQYRQINNKMSAIIQSIKVLQGTQDNDIIQ